MMRFVKLISGSIVAVFSSIVGAAFLSSNLFAENWVMMWQDIYSSTGDYTVWDVDAYVERDMFLRKYRRAIFVGSYRASATSQYGMAGTWDTDTSLHPIQGLRWFKYGGDIISFQSVDPIYTTFSPIRGRSLITVSKFWVGGYHAYDNIEGRDTNILIVKLDKDLNFLYGHEYDFNYGKDILYKIYTVNYEFPASNETISKPITNGFAGIGYTTYGDRFHNENILFVAGDSSGDIFIACTFETPGRDIGMGLYEIQPGEFIAIGYTTFNPWSDTAYSTVAIRFTVTPNGCNVKWARMYHNNASSNTHSLIPYDIERTTFIEGALYHIVGTAVPTGSDAPNQTRGFILTILDDGSLTGAKIYGYVDYTHTLALFEGYTDETSNELIAVGIAAIYGLNDNLIRFIGDIGAGLSSKNVLTEYAIVVRFNNYANVIGANIYSYRLRAIHRLFSVSKISDTSFISAGLYYNENSPPPSYLNYFAVKTVKPGLTPRPPCSGPTGVSTSSLPVNVVVPPLHVHSLQPISSPVFLTVEDPEYGACICGGPCKYFNVSFNLGSARGEACGSQEDENSKSVNVGPYEIYTSSGRLVRKGTGYVNLNDLPKGVYIVKQGGDIKVYVK